MEFSKEKNPTQFKIFSKRYFWVLVFSIIFLFSLVSLQAQPARGEGDDINNTAVSNSTLYDSTTGSASKSDWCNFLSTPGKCLLLPLFYFSGTLLRMSGTLFVWIIDTRNITFVLGNPAIFEIWTYVRDLLNMTFIMVLLFSAFCTIFQVEQYNYKKLLWKIVLMALLVNFSFPITRFIIDASNILMYSIIKSSLFSTSDVVSSFGNIAQNSSLAELISQKTWPDASTLLGATVMLFMLAITFLAIGVLLLIRIIVLAILIIFSPIAFVGPLIPGVSAQASKWWDQLFKYSFFGPIMILGVAIAVKFMNSVGAAMKQSFAIPGADINYTLIGNMLVIIVPIVLLWAVMGVAQSMSIAGAGAVMSGAQKVMKGAGKKFSGYNVIKKNYDDYKKERDARKEEARFKIGKRFGENVNDAQDTIAATVGPTKTIRDKALKRMDKRRLDKNNKDIDEGAKDLVAQGETADSLASKVNTTFSTTPKDKKGKVQQAREAQAYLRQDHDERKMHIQNNLQIGGGSDLNDILNATVPTEYTPGSAQETAYINAQTAANLAAHNIRMATPGKANEKDLRMVAAFINRQLKHKVETGAKAK